MVRWHWRVLRKAEAASLAAVRESVPVPEFITEIFVPGGFVPPCTPLNASVGGDTLKTGKGGGGGWTVKFTCKDAGDPCDPLEVTVTKPV